MNKYILHLLVCSSVFVGMFLLCPMAFAAVIYSGAAHDYHFSLSNPWGVYTTSTTLVDPDEVTSPLSAVPLLSSDTSHPFAHNIVNLDSSFYQYVDSFNSPSDASFGGNGSLPHAGTTNKFISFWVRFNSNSNGLEVLDSPGSGGQGFALYWTSGHLELYDFSGSGNINLSATSPVVDNTTWNNIVFNWTGSDTYDVYLNGSYTQTITVSNDTGFSFASLCGLWNGNCDSGQAVTNVVFGDTAVTSGFISSIWNGGVGNVICIVGDSNSACSGTPPSGGGNESISFGYPLNGMDTIQFPYWVELLTNLSTNTTYYIETAYFGYNISNGTTTTYRDYSSMNSGNATSVVWAYPKLTNLWTASDGTSTTQWIAVAGIGTDGTFESSDTSTVSVFTVDPRLVDLAASTYSNRAGQGVSYLTNVGGNVVSQYQCSLANIFSSASLNSLAQCVVNVTNVIDYNLFQPSNDALTALRTQFILFQTNPPFSLFTSLSTVVQQYALVNNSSTAVSSTYQTLLFNQSTTFLGDNPIVMMTSSSLASFIGEPAKEALFQDEEYFLWILLGLVITTSIYRKVKRS